MKKTIVMLLAVLTLVMLAACGSGKTPTPSPVVTAKPSATVAPATTAPVMSPSAETSPETTGGQAGGTIEGFTEGDTVEVDKLPEAVRKAVEEKYPGVTISHATYATHMESEMYLLTLTGGKEAPEKIYVDSDGKIEEYTSSPAPAEG